MQVDFDKVIVDTSDKEKMFDMQDKNMVKRPMSKTLFIILF